MEEFKFVIDSTKSVNDVLHYCNNNSIITISTGAFSLFTNFHEFELIENKVNNFTIMNANEKIQVGCIGGNRVYVDPTINFFDMTIIITNN